MRVRKKVENFQLPKVRDCIQMCTNWNLF